MIRVVRYLPINVETTLQKAIDVANEIAKLKGVTTAAPKQGRVLVTK